MMKCLMCQIDLGAVDQEEVWEEQEIKDRLLKERRKEKGHPIMPIKMILTGKLTSAILKLTLMNLHTASVTKFHMVK